MKKLLIIVVILLSGAYVVYAQGELDQQQKVFFRNERSFAFLLNTDGMGISYRTAKRINFLNKHFMEFEAGTLKSSKEYRQRNLIEGGSYVFGKQNSTIYLRGEVGRQHEIYSKQDFGGIAIRYFYSAGPVLALYKPIYYKFVYLVPGTLNQAEIHIEKFDPNVAVPAEVYGKAPFTKGLKETKIMPGLVAKAGFNFEYSKEDRAIHAIELGAQINVFPKDIPIMVIVNNKQIFFSLFVSYRFGMIIDPLHPETNSFMNIFKRKKSK